MYAYNTYTYIYIYIYICCCGGGSHIVSDTSSVSTVAPTDAVMFNSSCKEPRCRRNQTVISVRPVCLSTVLPVEVRHHHACEHSSWRSMWRCPASSLVDTVCARRVSQSESHTREQDTLGRGVDKQNQKG